LVIIQISKQVNYM